MGLALNRYHAALDFLFARTTGKTKFGLERTRALLRELGDPHDQFRSFHVAGTNGKGSVCATLDSLLAAGRRRVGRYTSPHLVDFRERIQVAGRPISEAAVVDWIERWTPVCEQLGATFFEATTAMAFDHFARSGVDVAVVEVGLGGRLDSTNVIRPVAAGVVSIGSDHTEYLGESLAQIAREKAGIFKSGVPAVIGEREITIRRLLAELAGAIGAEPVRVIAEEADPTDVKVGPDGTTFTYPGAAGPQRLRTPLAGAHQAANAAVALTMVEVAGPEFALTPADAERALGAVKLPGRFQRAGRFIFDVAHNPDGAAVLAETLEAVDVPRPLAALLCVLGDKNWRRIMDELAPAVDAFVLTCTPTAPANRAWRIEEALGYGLAKGWRVEAEPDFDRALARAQDVGRTVLATGSFHTAGDAMARLQVDPLAG